MSGAGPNAEGFGYLPQATAIHPDDTAAADDRAAFLLAVDNAYRAVHWKGIAKVLALMAQMDQLTAQVADNPELVACWRDMRLALHLIDIEELDLY